MFFDLDESRLKKEIKKRKPKIVLLQLPEGLKSECSRLVAIVNEFGALPIVFADPCYGACDLSISAAKLLGADLIIHYGHTPMILNPGIPTVYIEVKARGSIKDTIFKALPHLESYNKIGLVTTVQHIQQLKEAKIVLEDVGKTVFVGDAEKLKYAGQVLGCDFSNAQIIKRKVNSFLFIGGGRFHAIGVALATEKPTIIVDPYEQIAYPIQNQVKRIIMQRWASISEAKKAKSFGILVSLKNGQLHLKEAMKIKEKIEKHGFAAMLFALREITPNNIFQFPRIDAFVNTACARLSLDDAPHFSKPILSIKETLVVMGELKWEDLLKKGWFGNAI
jgi:2-(3-amino-3-carboxypropyl)histidine synthase